MAAEFGQWGRVRGIFRRLRRCRLGFALRGRAAQRGFGLLGVGTVRPQVAVVVVPGQGWGVGLQVHAHTQLAEIIGQHRHQLAEGLGIVQACGLRLEQCTALAHPGVAAVLVVVVGLRVEQHALQARNQRLEAHLRQFRLAAQQAAEQTSDAGVAAHQQAVDAHVLDGAGQRQAHRLALAGRLAARGMAQVADGVQRGGEVELVGRQDPRGRRLGQQQGGAVQHRARRRAVLRWAFQRLHVAIVDAEGVHHVAEGGQARGEAVDSGHRPPRRRQVRRPIQGGPPAHAACRGRR